MKTITYNPETHVLVPIEPSDEMLRKAIKVDLGKDCDEKGICINLYQVMLAAAPQPEPVDSEPVCEWVKADGANYIHPKWHKYYVAVEGGKLSNWLDEIESLRTENEALKQQVEQIEHETAEACAKVYLNTYDLTDIADDIRSGKWREYL